MIRKVFNPVTVERRSYGVAGFTIAKAMPGRSFFLIKTESVRSFGSRPSFCFPRLSLTNRPRPSFWGEKTVIVANGTRVRPIYYTGEWPLVAPVCKQAAPTHSKQLQENCQTKGVFPARRPFAPDWIGSHMTVPLAVCRQGRGILVSWGFWPATSVFLAWSSIS
jgi:hypothetical protein